MKHTRFWHLLCIKYATLTNADIQFVAISVTKNKYVCWNGVFQRGVLKYGEVSGDLELSKTIVSDYHSPLQEVSICKRTIN